MKRIVYLSRNDGTDMRVIKECRSLLEAGAQVIFIGWDWGQSDGVNDQLPVGAKKHIYRSGRGRKGISEVFGFMLHATSLLRSQKIDAIHCVNEELILLAFIARLSTSRSTIVGDLFDSMLLRAPNGPRGTPFRLVARVAHRIADRLIVTDGDRYDALPGASRRKAAIVPNYPLDPGPDLATSEPIAPGPKVFVGGSLSSQRGVEEILQAVRQLPGATILAAGWLYDDAARRFACEPEVDYRGVVSPPEAMHLAAECHLIFGYYAPTTRNNRMASPNKIYDALSLGRPMLLNSEVQVASWLVENDGGASAPYHDVDALASNISSLSEPIAWSRRSKHMRKLFEDGFSWQAGGSEQLLEVHSMRTGEGDVAESPPAVLVTTVFGGSGVGGHTFVEHLRKAGEVGDLEISFVTTSPAADTAATLIAPGFLVSHLPGKWLSVSLQFARELACRPPDNHEVIWFNNAMLAAALCIHRPRGLRETVLIGMINDYQNASATTFSGRARSRKFWRHLERFCARRLDFVVVNSEWMRRYITDSYGLDPARVRTLYKAVDLEPANEPVEDVALSLSPRLVGYMKSDPICGRLDELIRAVQLLPPDVELLVAGPQGEAIHPYRRLSQQLGLGDRIHFAGRLKRDEIAGFLGALDLFVNPAEEEALGVSMLEAMAVGTPVVARCVGGIPEVLAEGEAGMLFTNESGGLVAALKEALDEPRSCKARASFAQVHVQKFRPPLMIAEFRRLTTEAAALKRARA